jgi:hypothetical protein
MPTEADVPQFSDTVATAIGNGQDTPKGSSDQKRGQMKDQMAKRYAAEKIKTAGPFKFQAVATMWDVRDEADKGGDGWTRMRHKYSDKRALQRMIAQFRAEDAMAAAGDEPKCLFKLPRGLLKHRRDELLRVFPPLGRIAWFMQSVATGTQRPWVYFAADEGESPVCRSARFRKNSVRQGRGILEAAWAGERPCPRRLPRMGDKFGAAMAEFCLADNGDT